MNQDLYTSTKQCLVCKKAFEAVKVRDSKVRLIKRDTDFFRYYDGLNPYFYEINVCPNCGFAFSDNLKQDLTERQIDSFLNAVSQNWKKQDYNRERDINQAVETYKLALLSGQVIGLKDSIMAGICLRICWLNRLMQNADEENKYMKGAVDFFEKAYNIEELSGNESLAPEMIVYLLGELNYRLGNNSESAKWFNIAISKYSHDSSVKKQTIDMIRDRWLDIKQKVLSEK